MGAGSMLLCLRDLTERRRFEVSHNRDARFRAVVQNVAIVTMLVAPDGMVLSCSDALSRMLGHDHELLEGRWMVNLVTEDDRQAVMNAIVRAAQTYGPASPTTVTVGLTKIGEPLLTPFELSIVNLVDDPTVGGYVITGHDVTDRNQLEEELSDQAFHDLLTGLGNRALFFNRLSHSLENTKRDHDRVAALFLDTDGLKSANDGLGHAAGDGLLQSVARVLVECIRRSDTPARLGGDEFAVIVEDFTYPLEVASLADRVLVACRTPSTIGMQTLSGTVRIGLAFSRQGHVGGQFPGQGLFRTVRIRDAGSRQTGGVRSESGLTGRQRRHGLQSPHGIDQIDAGPTPDPRGAHLVARRQARNLRPLDAGIDPRVCTYRH
jgi:diguanylate cyclase (GGDEF)-like protein/PAS domain S-box-containing protein